MTSSGFTPENEEKIDRFLRSGAARGALSTLDMDGTCLANDLGEALLYHMARSSAFDADTLCQSEGVWEPLQRTPALAATLGELQRSLAPRPGPAADQRFLIQAYWEIARRIDKGTAEWWAALLLAGRTEEEVRDLARATLDEELKRDLGAEPALPGRPDSVQIATGIRPYEPMAKLIQRLTDQGMECWLVSASPRWAVEVFAARFLDLPPTRIVAAAPAVEDGRIQARPEPGWPFPYGPGKVEAIQARIGRAPALAAGNSMSDWDMLQLSTGLGLAIDADEALSRRVLEASRVEPQRWILQPRFSLS